ncbi:MAG: lysophospholipid acyltransferase family protein [Pseudomonadota bacterium]
MNPQTSPACSSPQMAKDLSVYLQSKTNIELFQHLPPNWGRWLLGGLGLKYFFSNPQKKEAIRNALDYCLPRPLTGVERRARWRRTREGIIDHYFEKLVLASYSLPKIKKTMTRIEPLGLEHLRDALALNKGVIFVTGHFGAVEYIPCALSLWGFPVTILVHCKTAALKKRMDALAEAIGARLIDPKEGSVFFDILRELREGRVIMTQCDEMGSWSPYKNRKTYFLGFDLELDRSLDLLRGKSGAPVLFGLNHRLPGGRFALVVEKPELHPAARSLKLTSEQCLAVLADYIYKSPQEWYEWAKMGLLVEKVIGKVTDAGRQRFGFLGEMAVQTPSAT